MPVLSRVRSEWVAVSAEGFCVSLNKYFHLCAYVPFGSLVASHKLRHTQNHTKQEHSNMCIQCKNAIRSLSGIKHSIIILNLQSSMLRRIDASMFGIRIIQICRILNNAHINTRFLEIKTKLNLFYHHLRGKHFEDCFRFEFISVGRSFKSE